MGRFFAALIHLMIFCLGVAIIVKTAQAIWRVFLYILNRIVAGITALFAYAGWIVAGCIILISLTIIVCFITDVTANWREKRRLHKVIKKSLAVSLFPSIGMFRSASRIRDESVHHPIDFKAAKLLGQAYYNEAGNYPDDRSFAGQIDQFDEFRASKLPRLVIKNRRSFEQEFAKLYHLFEQQNQAVVDWTHSSVRTHYRIRARWASMRRLAGSVAYILTMGKLEFGLKECEVWQSVNAESFYIDSVVFIELAMLEYFVNPIRLYVDETIEESIDQSEPLQLQPPAEIIEAEWVPSSEKKMAEVVIEEPEPIDTPDLSEEANRVVDLCVQFFNEDSERWERPRESFNELLGMLEGCEAFHQEPVVVHELVARVKECLSLLNLFQREFQGEMSRIIDVYDHRRPQWIQLAYGEAGEITVRNADCFERICCRHFINEFKSEKETQTVGEIGEVGFEGTPETGNKTSVDAPLLPPFGLGF